MNLYQKLAKIRKLVSVIKKDKQAYGYKYVPEDEILAKITAGMEKYNVSLIPMVMPGTFVITPHQSVNAKGKDCFEIIVSAEMQFKWVDDENPSEFIVVDWLLTGQQSDSSQAFGSGLTYCQRYFLLKYFQVATVDDDPDNWRSKKIEAEESEIAEELVQIKKGIVDMCNEKISAGVDKDVVYKAIADNNGGKKNPNSIKDITLAKNILEIVENLEVANE